jgi:YfiH family protein
MQASANFGWIVPDWPCPPTVRALITARSGGVSTGQFASMNLGDAVGDELECVLENRRRLGLQLPSTPRWLRQIHGNVTVDAGSSTDPIEADAAFASRQDIVCAVTVADCLPILLCNRSGTRVAAVHAGWRGLCAGVIENTVGTMNVPPIELMAYLGPAIGPDAFEVGRDVYSAFVEQDSQAAAAFRPHRPGKWLADLFMLARQRLNNAGVDAVFGGTLCTFSEPARFFSHRRDRISGRMAALIWRSG